MIFSSELACLMFFLIRTVLLPSLFSAMCFACLIFFSHVFVCGLLICEASVFFAFSFVRCNSVEPYLLCDGQLGFSIQIQYVHSVYAGMQIKYASLQVGGYLNGEIS